MEFPEVTALVDELELKLGTLDGIVSVAGEDGSPPKLEITSDQLEDLKGISSNFKDLIKCFNNHYNRRSGLKKAESTVELPQDLLLAMANTEDSAAKRANVAFIVQTFGGVQVLQDNKDRNLKKMAHSVLHSNVFTKELAKNIVGIHEKSGVYYLPNSFKQLGSDDKLRLARLLSWNSLKSWGFNAFEVDKITFKHEKQKGCPLVLIGWAILASPYAQVRLCCLS
jgi:hypothetical protein